MAHKITSGPSAVVSLIAGFLLYVCASTLSIASYIVHIAFAVFSFARVAINISGYAVQD